MQTIIVPVDFSTSSINAAYYACDLALLVKADIILMHTVTLPVTVSEVPVPYDYEQAIANAREQGALLKSWLVKYVNGKLPVSVQITAGSVMDEIRQLESDVQPFAVVMAAQEAGVVEAFLLGSYTQAVAHELSCPLVIVPQNARYRDIRKVGFACDMKDVDETLPVKGIRNLFQYLQASLDIFYVSKPGHENPADVTQGSVTILNELSRYHPEIKMQLHTNVEEGINQFVRDNKIDLLIVLVKDRHFPESVFHRSVHKKLMVHTEIPLILLHK